MDNLVYRKATIDDIPFLVDTIIEAEKSGTEVLTYSTFFGLSETETRHYLARMLEEEIDGCELSVSSFLLAEIDNTIAAAVAAWIEGIDGIPSTVLKGNLLNYTLPKESLAKAISLNSLVRETHIEYIPNTIQIGLVYVATNFRGRNLVNLLINKQIENLVKDNTNPSGVYVQVFGNNRPAIKAYEKAGFREIFIKQSTDNDILNYMPSDRKVLMKKDL